MREVLTVVNLFGDYAFDIPEIVVEEYISRNEIQRRAIKNIACYTTYPSGKYAVYNSEGNRVATFKFKRR